MKKNKYIYPAIFSFDDDGISVEFPDLPGCLTCGDTEDEAIRMAKDALGLHLYGMERDGDPLPVPSSLNEIKTESNQAVILIDVWMPVVRDEIENRAIKKTLTIPKWLNDIAEHNNVNFSQVLQSALKEHLGITRNSH
ncbi:MAG: type II toxin-antitoxin system HicB family antitoxin [Eubacteriales bacterium]|jgi:predicted RNase H-like HicB family nuclease|nr:type II toxin-antitoxin system HicB family antitoxin [Eubacteriales bacterium]